MSWQPSASLEVIQQRALLYQTIRDFFAQHQILEVDVPVLSAYATVDPFIDSMEVKGSSPRYLQTSPEFFLKRFLAACQTDCYYLGKAFRQEEKGARHNPEFTMLEWYRVNWQEQQLIDEVIQLIRRVLPIESECKFHYGEIFERYTGLNPHVASVSDLSAYAQSTMDVQLASSDKNVWLDLLFTHCVEPKLSEGLVVIDEYPASQAALARVDNDANGHAVARRFEVYYNKMELANGYWELVDFEEQRRRFENDSAYRKEQGLPDLPYDQELLGALKKGSFPECAGVALGIDRLLMCQLGIDDIRKVISFPSL